MVVVVVGGGCCLGVHSVDIYIYFFFFPYRRCGDCTYLFLFLEELVFFFSFSFVFCSPYLSICLRFFFVLLSVFIFSTGGGLFLPTAFVLFLHVCHSQSKGRVTPRYVTLRCYPTRSLHDQPTKAQIKKKITSTPPKMSRVAISLANAVLRVRVRVRANAAETRILAVREERVDIAVTAPAREGAAGRGAVVVVSKVCCVLVRWLVGWLVGGAEMGKTGSRSPAQHGAHCVGHEGAG